MMSFIKPPFPFPAKWGLVNNDPVIKKAWNVPAFHCHETLAIRMPTDKVQKTDQVDYDDLRPQPSPEEEEYMVDFALELNEEWSAKLLKTAMRLKLITSSKKPSKAKKAHKKKMRAKSKMKKQMILKQQEVCSTILDNKLADEVYLESCDDNK